MFENKLFLILFWIMTWSSVCCIAQRQRVTVRASGTAIGTDLSTTEAEALYKAKKNALINAGFTETVSTFTTVHVGENVEASDVLSDELSVIEMDGRVLLKREPSYSKAIVNDQISCTAEILADVIWDEKKSDLEFSCRVSGFENTYHNGDLIDFYVQPSKDGYLRVFWFDTSPKSCNPGDLIYPHPDYFRDVKLLKENTYTFPPTSNVFNINGEIDIAAEKLQDVPIESNLILVVLLKRPIQFTDVVTYQSVYRWLINIPADERYYKWIKIDITK